MNLELNLRQHETQYSNGTQGYLSVNPFRAVASHVTALHAAPSLTANDLSVVAFTEGKWHLLPIYRLQLLLAH